MERLYVLYMQTYNKMIKKWSCDHMAHDSSVWRHIFWGNDRLSVSPGTKQQWTDVLDCYSDRKSAENNKCKKREDMRSTHSHLTQGAMWVVLWQCPLCCYNVPLSISSPTCHPSTITAIILSREGVSYLLLSCDDGWHRLFSRVWEQASITQSIPAPSAS